MEEFRLVSFVGGEMREMRCGRGCRCAHYGIGRIDVPALLNTHTFLHYSLHARGEAVRGEQRPHQLLRPRLLEDGQVAPEVCR